MDELADKISAIRQSASYRKLEVSDKSTRDMLSTRTALRQWLEKCIGNESSKHIDDTLSGIRSRLGTLGDMKTEDIQFDLARIIACREFGRKVWFAFQYIMEGFMQSSRLRPILYMALSLFESQQQPPFSVQFFEAVEADLCEHNIHMMKWMACTCVSFSPTLLDVIAVHMKSMVFHSVKETHLVCLASAVLVNLCRNQGKEMFFADIIPRYRTIWKRYTQQQPPTRYPLSLIHPMSSGFRES